MAGYCIYSSVEGLIQPLRTLNNRMHDIMSAETLGDLPDDKKQSCFEIEELQRLFRNLISNKKFSNNEYLKKSDTLAVIDLAEANEQFE